MFARPRDYAVFDDKCQKCLANDVNLILCIPLYLLSNSVFIKVLSYAADSVDRPHQQRSNPLTASPMRSRRPGGSTLHPAEVCLPVPRRGLTPPYPLLRRLYDGWTAETGFDRLEGPCKLHSVIYSGFHFLTFDASNGRGSLVLSKVRVWLPRHLGTYLGKAHNSSPATPLKASPLPPPLPIPMGSAPLCNIPTLQQARLWLVFFFFSWTCSSSDLLQADDLEKDTRIATRLDTQRLRLPSLP